MVTLFKPCEIARYTANRDNARFPSIFGCQLYLHILIKCFWRTKSFCNGCRHRCTKLIRSRFISSSYHQHILHIREGSIASRRCHRLNQPVETCVDSFGNCFLSPFDTVHERKLPSTLWKCCVYFRECSFEHCLLLSLLWCWLWWSFWHPNLPNFICDFLHTSKCIIVCLSILAIHVPPGREIRRWVNHRKFSSFIYLFSLLVVLLVIWLDVYAFISHLFTLWNFTWFPLIFSVRRRENSQIFLENFSYSWNYGWLQQFWSFSGYFENISRSLIYSPFNHYRESDYFPACRSATKNIYKPIESKSHKQFFFARLFTFWLCLQLLWRTLILCVCVCVYLKRALQS